MRKWRFNEKGTLIDVYMLTDPRGVFRRICFIGYKTQDDAEIAVKYYDNAIFKNHKIKVEFTKDNSESNENKPNETTFRKIKYSKTIIIKQLTPKLDSDLLMDEMKKIGSVENIKLEKVEKGIIVIVKFKDGKHALDVYKSMKVFMGMRVVVSPYTEKSVSKRQAYYNTLFFNFDTVLKRTREASKLSITDIVDFKDKDFGSRMAMLEADLINQTKTFLENNGIYLDTITDEKSKNILIVRNSDILGALDLVKEGC